MSTLFRVIQNFSKSTSFPNIMKSKKIKSHIKATSDNNQEKSNEMDLFSTLYGDNPTFIQEKEIKIISKFPKNVYSDDNRSPRRYKAKNNPIAPIDINLNSPRVIVPQPKPTKPNSKSNLFKNAKSKLMPEPSPRRILHQSYDIPKLPPTPSTNPRISNDHLSMFDDTTYDDQQFLQNIISLINSNEPVFAKSLFYHQNGQCEWRKCYVVGYNEPRFVIKFDPESNKTKEVARVAIKFDLDDQKRFDNRRNEAYSNRIEVDTQLRLETYLYSRAMKTKGVNLDAEILKNIIKKIGQISKQKEANKIKKSYKDENFEKKNLNIINNLVPEVNDNYLFADTFAQFVLEWEDPKAATKFTKSGLERVNLEIKPWKSSPGKLDIENKYLKKVVLPDQTLLQKIVYHCNSFKSKDFMIFMFKQMHPPIQLSYFFEQLKFEVNASASDARVNLKMNLTKLLKAIIQNLNRNVSEKIEMMVNLRYKEVLASIINHVFINTYDMMKKYKIKFDISVESDLKTIHPSFETIEIFGIESMEWILKTYDNNKTPEIEVLGKDPQLLSISFDYLNENFEKAKKQYLEILEKDKKVYEKLVENILDITQNIPVNPEKVTKEILQVDYFKDDLTKDNFDFDLISEKLNNAKLCYNRFLLTFSEKVESDLCSFDIKQFFQSTINNYNQFYSLIFNQLELIADYQTSKIHNNVETLENKSGKSSNSIEEWYEKHCILLEIRSNIRKIENKLDFVLSIINFMTDFQYQPQHDYSYVINVKKHLLNVYMNIKQYNDLDYKERVEFIKIHRKNIEDFQKELEEFQVDLMNFHYIKSNESNYPLLIKCKENYDKIIDKMNLYHNRDSKLELPKTEYQIIEILETEINDILCVWTIGHKLETDVEHWLTIPFRELDIKNIAQSLVDWRSKLENLHSKIEEEQSTNLKDDDDLIIPTIENYQARIKELIIHLPIVTALCNKHLRGRHWYKINNVSTIHIDINEGLTWNWLIECGIEDYMLSIQSICRTADSEFKIESALSEMVEELQTMRLHVNESNGVLRLEDPSFAMIMLGKHQQKLQEIFIPPHVHPFLERIHDYNVLASNLRQILKQTIEAQQKIDELKPAMDSNDIRTQHEEMAVKFDNQVQKFNEFTGSFKLSLSLSFHQILGSERYMNISSELLTNFNNIRENLGIVLEEKRKICPRFRLLSDNQLVFLLSNCNKPSVTKKVFSLMYSSVKKILLENENYCVGFISKSGENIIFENKIRVTPEAIEKWHLEFDNEIKRTMIKMTQIVITQAPMFIEKVLVKFPIQIICLVYETIFTSNVNKAFSSLESRFVDDKRNDFLGFLQNYLSSITKDISNISGLYKKLKIKSISSLILTLLNQRDLLTKMIQNKVDSSSNHFWYSNTKFVISNQDSDDLSISVQIGPISYEYGFEYTGDQRLIIKTADFNHFFSNFLLSISNSVIPLFYADVETRKTEFVIDFAAVLGYNPFVYPCYSSTTIEKLKSAIKNARECNEFLILEGIDQLMPNTLNELSVWTFCETNKSPIIATYSVLSKENSNEVPEQLKLYYRPVHLKSINLEKKYKLILESLLICDSKESCEYTSSRFAYLTQTVSKLFRPPLNTILMENSIIQFFRNHPSVSIEELVQSFIIHIKSYLVEYDLNEMLEYINLLFNDLKIDFDPAVDYNISEGLIKTKNKEEEEIEIEDEFDQNILYTFKSHYGIIVLGRAMTGKTTLIENVANKMKKKLLYINPFSIPMENLYGDKSSGLLSSLLTENGTDQWIVFDGSCKADWMELASYVLTNNNRRMAFGDGSMLVLASSFRIIFETDDISMASPLILGACTTIYISDDRISLSDHLNKYLNTLSNETRIIEPLSNTIVGSATSASNLINIVKTFFDHFVPKISEFVESLNCRLTVSKVSHFVINFFECFHCSLLNYYIPEKNHSADDLLKDSPNLLLFALFWSFGGSYENESRIRISDFLIEISEQYIQSINSDLSILSNKESSDKKVYLFDCYYDEECHSWKNWIEQENVLPDLMDVSPYSIFIPSSSLISVYSILKGLIHQNMNVLLFGDDANHITPYVNLCLNSDYFLSEMSVIICNSFGKINVDEILHSFLPDLNATNGLSIRYPLLALLGIDITPCNRNSELLRFIMEHKFFRNNKTFVDESVPSLRHLLTTDKKELNPRLSHFCFLLNVEKEDNQVLKDSFAYSIEKMWKIDSKISSFISELLLQTLEKVQVKSPHFNFNSLQLIFQRITMNLNKDCCLKNIIENISEEMKFTFYESTRSENILSIINDSNLQLTNQYNELNNDDPVTLIPLENINVESRDESLKFDINEMTKLLKTFRNNIVIKSNSKEIPFDIIEKSCENNDIFLHQKNLEEELLQAYHDCFVHAGMKKEHSVLLLDDSILQTQELELLNLILKNSNIFGLFSKGEQMKLMSELHSKDANSYDEETTETAKSFNFVLSEFLCNCEKYCHIVIVSHSQNENVFKNVSVYVPLTQSVTDDRFLHLKDLLQTNLSHLFSNYPYLLSDKNLNFILTKIDEKERKIKKKVESINERFSTLKESQEINDSFLQEYLIKMKNTEIDIKQLNKELKISMENLQHLQEISEEQTIAFEKEAEELKAEESKAQILRKECENQLSETKAILETASQEVKHLSSRDTSVIKGMNHPPKGVVLVVIAMCIVMDVDIDYNEKKDDLTDAWTKGRSVMNDPSFLNKLITTALDSLSPLIIQKLEPIVNDPNFEPTIIEKSSSAAKSICIFIRSLIPYFDALNIYKEKNLQMREMEEKLEKLIEKQNEAMQKLTLSKNKCMENQIKIEKLTQTKNSYEDQLTNQREKIGFYQKFKEIIESYTNEKFDFFTNKINKSKEAIESLIIKQVFKDLCGPFTDSQRNEFLKCLQNGLNNSIQSRESLLYCDNSVVKKWHKLQYPVSQFWKENTSLMAPEGGRWVVVEGLRCCSSSYLKKVLNSPSLPTLSVFSVTFEIDFIQMIQKSNRIIVTDYDFNHPSLIVSLVYKSIENKENNFIYKNEEITFQKDLIVYFDVDSLPSVSYIDFVPLMVNLRVGSAISTEQISLTMFQLMPQFSEIQRNESSIYSSKQQISEVESEIESLLIENRIEIFDSKDIQKRFIDKSKERSKIINDLNELKETHVTLFETFSEALKNASEICQSFEKFPIQTSLWKIYENRFQMMPTLNIETIKTNLTTVILSSLPSKLRMSTILNVNSILPENFDSDFEKVASFVGNNEMIRLQNPQTIINETAPNRPVFVVSPSSQFEICSLINYLKNEEKTSEQSFNVYDYSDDISMVIQNSMSKGSIVAILLNSIDDIKNSISAVSIVLSQSVFNQSFRLFLIVTFPLHHENDVISHKIILPSVVTFCDTFYFTQPFNACSIYTQLNPSNRVCQKLAAFHSVSSIIRKFKLCGKVHDFSNFLLAKKCIEKEDSETHSDEIGAIEIFVSLFIYEFVNEKEDIEIDDYTQNLSEMWNAKISMNSELDSPENLGLGEHDFDFYKDKFYIFQKKRKSQTENQKNNENTEKFDDKKDESKNDIERKNNENKEESNQEDQISIENNENCKNKRNEIIEDQSHQNENEDTEKDQSSEEFLENNEIINDKDHQDENESFENSNNDAENETIDDQIPQNQNEDESEEKDQSSEEDLENNEIINDKGHQDENESFENSNNDVENDETIDDQIPQNQNEDESEEKDQSSEEDLENDEDKESTKSNEYESRDDEIIIITNDSYSNTSNDDYESHSESSEKIDDSHEILSSKSSSGEEEVDFSLLYNSNVGRFEEDDGFQSSLQQLAKIDLTAISEIPRNLSHEFDFAEEKLRSISEGKSDFTSFFQHQLMQLINVPEIYDMSLFVSPIDFFEITKSEFMKNNGFYSKTVLMIEDSSKYYEELIPCGTICKGIAVLNASFTNGQLAQFDGFSSLNEFWLKPVSYDSKLELNPILFYKDGEIVDSLYIRFKGNSEELKKVVFISDV